MFSEPKELMNHEQQPVQQLQWMHEDSDDLNLGFEQSFACIVTMIIYNAYLYSQIKYGNMTITHVSMRPYKIAFLFLLIALAETVYVLILSDVVFANDFKVFLHHWTESKYFKRLIIGFEMSKFCAIIAFLLSQTFEYQVLYTFVLFQQMIRVEQLPVEKNRY